MTSGRRAASRRSGSRPRSSPACPPRSSRRTGPAAPTAAGAGPMRPRRSTATRAPMHRPTRPGRMRAPMRPATTPTVTGWRRSCRLPARSPGRATSARMGLTLMTRTPSHPSRGLLQSRVVSEPGTCGTIPRTPGSRLPSGTRSLGRADRRMPRDDDSLHGRRSPGRRRCRSWLPTRIAAHVTSKRSALALWTMIRPRTSDAPPKYSPTIAPIRASVVADLEGREEERQRVRDPDLAQDRPLARGIRAHQLERSRARPG